MRFTRTALPFPERWSPAQRWRANAAAIDALNLKAVAGLSKRGPPAVV